MKRQHLSECSLLEKASELSKLCKNEERVTKITQKFASINKNLLQKTEVEITIANQQASTISKINTIQQKMQNSVRKWQQKIDISREKLRSVRQNQAKIETSFKQKVNTTSLKLKKIKLKFNSVLFEEHYRHQQILSQVQQQFQRVLQKTQHNNHLFGQKIIQKNALKVSEKLTKEINELKGQNETIQAQESKKMEALVSQLQSKLKQLKEKLNQSQSIHQQALNEVKEKIQIMKQEFQTELNQERAVRQQNKQKLLTLLQNNISTSLNKTLK